MELFEDISKWMKEHPVSSSVLKYLIIAGTILLIIAFLRRVLRKKLPDSRIRYKSQKIVELFGYFILVLVTISFFTGNVKDIALAAGLLTAGITITLQELILSVAGSFYIFLVGVYKPGDRIEINNIKGDVIDVDSIYTTMMEIGEWVSSDNYSGRIVKLSNAFVFKGPVYNYSKDFPFVWDEFNIPIRYGSDIELAKSIITKIASETLSQYVAESITDWHQVVNKYYIENAQVNPTLAITMNDNWIQFNLRYIVDYKRRRFTKGLLNERIGKEILNSDGKIQYASTTLEIVDIPTIALKKE
jgi:small-conductance mechanosensitive channel